MSLLRHRFSMWSTKWANRMSPTKVIAVVFLLIILLGAVLLTTPLATRDGEGCDFLSALFTATSATCVTGLNLFDTWTQWSGFGQAVILCLIQVGGLGFMSVAMFFALMFNRRVSLKQRLVIAQGMGLNELGGVVKLQKQAILGTFLVEGICALALFFRFLPAYGPWTALKWVVFHSVSAYCNAGFDIFGQVAPDASMMLFAEDPFVCGIIMFLVVVGGIGFFVLSDLLSKRSFQKLTVYSKLVLVMTGGLLVGGTAGICLTEWNNPATLGGMTTGHKILNALFQSVTTRTAGFSSFDQGAMTEAGKAFSAFLMLIGGSSGSTAGGMKTVTLGLVLINTVTRARGGSHVTIFKRSIAQEQIADALTIFVLMVVLTFFGGIAFTADAGCSFMDGLFESASALATVGLTANVTRMLSPFGQMLDIMFMFFGRVGILTISLGFLMGDRAKARYQYAETKLIIG